MIYRTINYHPAKIFPWFVEHVTEAQRTGDVEKSKALLVEIFKLLGNSAYGKMIEALEQQTYMRRWSTEPCKARTSRIWMNLG